MKSSLILLAAAGLALGTASGAIAPAKSYPLKTCLVTGNKLGSMGSPVKKVYSGQEVKFCCKPCVAKFEKSPDRFLAKLR